MAINLDDIAEYNGKVTAPSAAYPGGSYKNETAPLAVDGTPLENQWLNDWLGFFQALLGNAAIVPSGVPDTAVASDYFDALTTIFSGTIKIPIGPWNMDTNQSVFIPDGSVEITSASIRTVQVIILDDTETLIRDIGNFSGTINGTWNYNGNGFNLSRTAGGFFDSVNYNDGVINRGFITVGIV